MHHDGIWQRERAYRRRLYMLTPVAIIAMTALFLTSDRIPYREIQQAVGWEGEMRLLPEITIVPDESEAIAQLQQFRVDAMTSVDLDVAEYGDFSVPSERDLEDDADDQVDVSFEEYEVRTVQSAREVPYSEDYVILKMVEPEYPQEELNAGIEGNVTVELLINTSGRVEKATILSAVGPVSFQEASLDAVRQFVFQPPVVRGKRETMWIKFLIKFRIFS